jgi:cell division protein FtsI/penicillin-binding protein 2
LNPAIKSLYEPGSVLKVITMAAGIDSGKFTPDTTYYDSGSVTLNGKVIKNWDKKAYGKVTMTNVIENSINTGAVWAENKIGDDLFYNYLVGFGLNKPTGVDFLEERTGNLSNLETKKASDVDFATASFGQGVAVTPLELINAFSAIANGGKLMRPYFNAELKPQVIKQVISEEASRQVKAMMVSAVDKAGVATIANYRVAGKTGTAQVPDFKNGGYTLDVIDSYIGFAPVDNPRFIIFLKLDKPKGAPLAGLTVVPAFKDLAQFVLNYYNIPPDRLTTNN